MNGTGRVLVFGDDTRSFLATVRALGKAGIEVHAAPFNFRAPALASRHIRGIHRIPWYLGDGGAWLETVSALFERYRFDLVIPCDERALIPLHLHRGKLSALCGLAIPDPRALKVLFDKHETRMLASELGIPVLPGGLIDETATATDLILCCGLPLVIKPRASYTPEQLYARNIVEIVRGPQALAKALRTARESPSYFEAFFKGVGVGVSVLASRGRILQGFQHRRVRELRGSSFYRVSTPVSPPLLDAVARLLAALGYTGVAMFEFRVNEQTNEYRLLEVNARPWGSLPLPTALGVDFPGRLYQLLAQGVETPSRPYKTGIYGRNVVSDLRQILRQGENRRPSLRGVLAGCAASAREVSRMLRGREVHDVFKADDPVPGLREIGETLGAMCEKSMERLPGYRAWQERRDRQRARGAAARTTNKPFTVVFVCQGNICRSPFAAALLRRRLADVANVRILSAGNLPRENRPSPPAAIAAARNWNVDLQEHKSAHFGDEMASGAHLVVIFDATNRRWIGERYPALASPVVSLASFTAAPFPDGIADPDGSDAEQFRSVYAMIDKGVAGLADDIRRGLS